MANPRVYFRPMSTTVTGAGAIEYLLTHFNSGK